MRGTRSEQGEASRVRWVDTGRRRRILLLAWLAAPNRGSEWAAAWGMALAATALGEVTILTEPDSAEAIRGWLAENPGVPIEVVGVDAEPSWWLPLAERVLKGHFLYYFRWLAVARETALALHAARPFDVAVHGALGCYWLPSPVVDLGVPSVWGPVAGAMKPPLSLLPLMSWKGLLERAVERPIVRIASMLPATRRTMRRADLVLVENLATLPALPSDVAARAGVLARAVLSPVPTLPPLPRGRYVLFPSLLDSRKGPLLALEAFPSVPADCTLKFINTGPEEPRLRQRAAELGLADRVEFLGRVPRERYFELVRGAGAVVFAGLNEDGGCALCEAMALGAPVVVLAHGGPAEIVERWGTDPNRAALVPPTGPAATARALGAALARFLTDPPAAHESYLDQAGAMLEMARLLGVAVAAERSATPTPADPRSPAKTPWSVGPAPQRATTVPLAIAAIEQIAVPSDGPPTSLPTPS